VNARAVAVRAGVGRGWAEFRQRATSFGDLVGELWPWIIALVVLYSLSGRTVLGSGVDVGLQGVPGVLGVSVVYTGLLGLSLVLINDQADGTLLRMKAVPNGMIGYLVGTVLGRAVLCVETALILLALSVYLFDDVQVNRPFTWFVLPCVLALGLLAILPLGVVLGAAFRSRASLGLVTLPVMGLLAISGVFYPLAELPLFLQGIAQLFPVYWLGLGLRWALLPSPAALAEVDGAWRHLEMVGVLGAWAVVGLVAAPVMLRRMARREPGSTVRPDAAGQG
jgi:ABC-2 type transport system permease protein